MNLLVIHKQQLLINVGCNVRELSVINEPFAPRNDVGLTAIFSMSKTIVLRRTRTVRDRSYFKTE